MSDLRIRLEGALETVERAVIEAEHAALRLRHDNTRGLVAVLRQLDDAEPACAKVERCVAEAPTLKPLLARLEVAREAITTHVTQQATLRGYPPGTLVDHAQLLETERVFFTGAVSSMWAYWLLSGLAVGLGVVTFFVELAQGKREFIFLGFSALAPIFYLPAARRAVRLRVSSRSLRIGSEEVALSEVARLEVVERRVGRGAVAFVTIVDTQGRDRRPVRLASLPEAFMRALDDAGVKVALTRA